MEIVPVLWVPRLASMGMVLAIFSVARFGAAAQGEEARRQLDQQRNLLEEQLYGSVIEDQIANALRRFAVAQTVGGLA